MLVGNGEGRQHAQGVAVETATEHDEAMGEGTLAGGLGEFGGRGAGFAILDELDGEHGAEAADIANAGELGFGGHGVKAFGHDLADLGGAFAKFFLGDDVEHREGGGAGERVAAVGATEATGPGRIHEGGFADHASEGQAAGEGFGNGDEVGDDAGVFDGKHLAGAGETSLHLVGHEEDAVLIAEGAKATKKVGRGDIEATFALHGLEDDGGDLVGRDVTLKQGGNGVEGIIGRDAVIFDRKRNMVDLARQGPEAGFVGDDFASHGHGHHGAAMEGAGEGDDAGSTGGGAGNLNGVFNGFGAGAEQNCFVGPVSRGEGVEALGELNVGLVGGDLEGDVAVAIHLSRYGGFDFGMTVTGIGHRDACREIDIAFAIGVPDLGVGGAGGVDREGLTDSTGNRGLASSQEFLIWIWSDGSGLS